MNAASIQEELVRVVNLAKSLDISFFDNSHKRDREWWVLGHATDLLRRAGHAYPTHAQTTIPPEPDFITYLADGRAFKRIEIAEVLRHGRKRHDEIKRAYSSDLTMPKTIHTVKDPFQSFRKVLLSKFNKRYGSGCWLVLLHSMMIFEFPEDWTRGWANLLREKTERWKREGNALALARSPYEKIFVLNSSGNELVSIYPDWLVIYPTRPIG